MERTRVKRGEKYFYISSENDYYTDLDISYRYEYGFPVDDSYFQSGNYFHTEEDAQNMIYRISAVLKGADVIEMPSEEEIESNADKQIHNCSPMPDSVDYNGGFWDAINYLKSKIVK